MHFCLLLENIDLCLVNFLSFFFSCSSKLIIDYYILAVALPGEFFFNCRNQQPYICFFITSTILMMFIIPFKVLKYLLSN